MGGRRQMWVTGPQCYETSKVGFISKKTRSKKEMNFFTYGPALGITSSDWMGVCEL